MTNFTAPAKLAAIIAQQAARVAKSEKLAAHRTALAELYPEDKHHARAAKFAQESLERTEKSAAKLVAAAQAEHDAVANPQPEPTAETTEPTTDKVAAMLQNCTVARLRKLATRAQIVGRSGMKRSTLLAHLKADYGQDHVGLGYVLEALDLENDAKPAKKTAPAPYRPRVKVSLKETYLAAIGSSTEQENAKSWPPKSNWFPSGSNHEGEIQGLADAGQNVGVAVNQINAAAEAALVELAGSTTQVFVDSGAFSEVDFTPAPTVVKPITPEQWAERLDIYQRLADALGPQLHPVAPDMVAHQTETLARLEHYAPRLRKLAATGAQVMVPHQKGERTLAEFNRAAHAILGFDFTVAVPMQKDATSVEELAELAAAVKPTRMHLLGRGPKSDIYPAAVAAILAASPTTIIQCDSAGIRALSGKTNGPGGGPRAITTAADEAMETVRATMWAENVPTAMDYTDWIAEPTAWLSKAGLAQLRTDLVNEAQADLDPDTDLQAWLANSGNDWTDAVLDRYWAAYQEKHGTTTWRKRTAVAKVFSAETTSTEAPTAEPTGHQTALFGVEATQERSSSPWEPTTRHPGSGRLVAWANFRTNYQVRHCGHPTANFPYYIVSPDHDQHILHPGGPGGTGFRTLQEAQTAADRVAHGLATTKVNNSGRLVVAELARPMAKCDSLNLSPAFRDRLQADLAKMGQAAVGRYVGRDSK